MNNNSSAFWENANDPRYFRVRMIEICNIILTSDDDAAVHRAYDMLFNVYKYQILYGTFAGSVSLLEDVILKLLNDNENNKFAKYGDKYNPFIKFIVLLREQMNKLEVQEEFIKIHGMQKSNGAKYIPKHADLSRYLLMYNLETGNDFKDEYLNTILHKRYKKLHD